MPYPYLPPSVGIALTVLLVVLAFHLAIIRALRHDQRTLAAALVLGSLLVAVAGLTGTVITVLA